MPGRLLPSFSRGPASAVSPSQSSASSSRTSSINETTPHPTVPKMPVIQINSHDAQSPERRRSFSMEHLIHPHRDHHKEKRRSFGRSSRSRERPAKEVAPSATVKLDVVVESPPLVSYGQPATSTGCLLSGRLIINVPETAVAVKLDKLVMRLECKATTKKPISRDCPNCSSRTEELMTWTFLNDPMFLKSGNHDFPFSYLFFGNRPATCNGILGGIEYALSAFALVGTEEFTFSKSLVLKRAILPGNDKSSIRIFPPTNLAGRVVLPPVVHPIGTFPVQMTLSGVVEKGEEMHTRWRLRKMMWRIEEHQKIVSTPCPKHAHKVGGDGKGVLHQETRVIGHNEEKSGWKTDFDTAGGEIWMEFDANINPSFDPVCDQTTSGGLEVRHNLVIELIVGEEVCPNRNPRLVTPTGAARVLRMQFNLLVTERSGLGISWDEEMPPVYEDVPASPPGYTKIVGDATIEDYCGSPLPVPDYEELDRMESLTRQTTESTLQGRQCLTIEDLAAEPSAPVVSRSPLAHTEEHEDEATGIIDASRRVSTV